jgi:hypothetical protein
MAVNIAAASAQTDPQSIVHPGSPEAAFLLHQLKDAEDSDRGNSISYTSDDPSLGHHYARKADEVSALIKRLEGGEQVAPVEIDNALDNSEARFY